MQDFNGVIAKDEVPLRVTLKRAPNESLAREA